MPLEVAHLSDQLFVIAYQRRGHHAPVLWPKMVELGAPIFPLLDEQVVAHVNQLLAKERLADPTLLVHAGSHHSNPSGLVHFRVLPRATRHPHARASSL